MAKQIIVSAKPEAADLSIHFERFANGDGTFTTRCRVGIATDGPPGYDVDSREYNYPAQMPAYPGGITNAQFTACLKAIRDKALVDLGYGP